MVCEYEAKFELSKEVVKECLEEIKVIVEDLKPKLSEPEAFDYKLSSSSNSLSLKVSCKENSATDFILQFEKKLKELLGKKYKMGIKEIFVLNYKLEIELEKEPKEGFKIPFASELKIYGKKASLFYKALDWDFVKNYNIERSVKLVDEKIAKQYYEGKGEHHEVLYNSKKIKPVWDKDPTEEMVKLGWLCRGPSKGKWIYRPEITAIMKAMEQIAIKELLEPLGFCEMIGSSFVSGDKIWKRTGHLEGMPMEIYYVAEPVTRDPKAWQGFIDKLKITREVPQDEFSKMVQLNPLNGLCYAQCPGLYWSFEKKTIADSDLPIKIFDKTLVSFRYESGGRHGIERVDEFHRIEPIYIGTPEQLIELKEKIVEIYKKIFDEILELEWRSAWVTPFYMQQAGSEFKQDYDQKVKGTIDYEAWLPYRGSREGSEWLEFQNLSIVGEKYIKAFNIKAQTKELWSGCSGIGLERWTIAFLAQKGLDPKNWPKGFKKYLSKLPKGFNFL